MAVGKDEAVEIVKPRTDKRDYRRIVLHNSLQVLLISDPETDKVFSRFVQFSCYSQLLRFGLVRFNSIVDLGGLYTSHVFSDQCAACMEVGIGSFSDPEGLEGLAHFLGEENNYFIFLKQFF